MSRYYLNGPRIPQEYKSDVWDISDKLQQIDITVDADDIYTAWSEYSDAMAAGWMMVPENPQDVWNCISSYFSRFP